jgi:hypothetical protein
MMILMVSFSSESSWWFLFSSDLDGFFHLWWWSDGFFCLWWWSWWFLSPLNLLDCFFIFWSRVRQVL